MPFLHFSFIFAWLQGSICTFAPVRYSLCHEMRKIAISILEKFKIYFEMQEKRRTLPMRAV
jgi:hypothetical protein